MARATMTIASAAAAVAGFASVAACLPSSQAFIPALPTHGRGLSGHSTFAETSVSVLSMSYGAKECPEIPTTPLLSGANEVAVIALG